ncbi:hypothetical protein AAG570_000782 [Ranatra chinensis]|uniref:Corticotropin-releasing factor binding protein C-terminal domain-containing protein n=1 Tax=Ranatra chinensis TaxID=642074 RepID=A0ABD0Z058_9HEMI
MASGGRDVYTLRNYGRRTNCSLTALMPVKMSVLSLGVGMALANTNFQIETGTIPKCKDKGLSDYVLIGGGEDLGLKKISILDTVCGVDSYPGRISETINCGVSTVKLVSSGNYENSVTVYFREANEQDIATFDCPI